MADTDELYISVHPETYRSGKAGVLICKSSTLIGMKKLQNLKILSRQKDDLKKELMRLFSSVKNNILDIQEMIPTMDVPKIVKKVISPQKKKVTVVKEFKTPKPIATSEETAIDVELRMIREKLRELNS